PLPDLPPFPARRSSDLDRAAAVDYLVREIQRLADAHADFGAIAANTPHILFDEVQARSAIPLISIVETVYTAARTAGLKRLGLLDRKSTRLNSSHVAIS